jgi:cytochrome P450
MTARSIPGDAGLPLLGYTFQSLHDPMGMLRERYARYGPVSWSRAFGMRVVHLLGPDAVGAVLVNRDKAFSSGQGWAPFIDRFFPRGLMLLDFAEHHHHRRIMQQAFTTDRLRGYLDQLHPAITGTLRQWRPHDRFQLYPAFKQLTLDLATKVFMGAALDRDAARVNRAFVASVRAGTAYLRAPVPGGRWARGLHGRRVLEELLAAHLPAKRASGGEDLFSALCQAETDDGHRFTDADVVNHMIFLLMAAHDTSTITLSTMGYYLARHPDWQDRVRAESLALGTDTPGYGELDRLVAMDLVMKESLRLLAPVPSIPRAAVRDTEVLGYAVPAGSHVVVSPQFTHHLADYWPDPERFDPERFAADRREDKVHPHAWVPFGSGVHKCIGMYFGGMEVKAVLHQLVRRFRWSVEPGYRMPIDWKALPVPRDRLPVRLERL